MYQHTPIFWQHTLHRCNFPTNSGFLNDKTEPTFVSYFLRIFSYILTNFNIFPSNAFTLNAINI